MRLSGWTRNAGDLNRIGKINLERMASSSREKTIEFEYAELAQRWRLHLADQTTHVEVGP